MPEVSRNKTYTRLEILTAIAESYMQYNLANIDNLPDLILPDNTPSQRGSLGRDRLIVKIQCMAAMGYTAAFLPVNTRLSELVYETLTRATPQKATVSIIREACEACKQCYVVGDRCRSCSAALCKTNCPQRAVIIDQQAYINQNRCNKCGICYSECPYSAIIKQVVPCEEICPVKALGKEYDGREYINQNKCIACGQCLVSCPFEAIVYNSQIIDVLKALRDPQKKNIALLTAEIVAKFGNDWDNLVAAFKKLGFDEVRQATPRIALGNTATEPQKLAAEEIKMITATKHQTSVVTDEKLVPQIVPQAQSEYNIVLIGSYLAERVQAQDNPNIQNSLIFEEAVALLKAAKIL